MVRPHLSFLALVIATALLSSNRPATAQSNPTEAPTGFDGESNGLTDQATFEEDQEVFEEVEELDEGLGPIFNATSCVGCHQNPVAGGGSQVTELRVGFSDRGRFVDPPGGSLINDRAIDPAIQELVPAGARFRELRMSLSTLGDGYIEAIADETLIALAEEQRQQSRGRIRGKARMVPILESPGATRVGRFGWKDQLASLESFAADAYLNEMGITSPHLPEENTSLGRSVAAFDEVDDPEDEDGEDVLAFARFMRATKAPSRDEALASTPEAVAGAQIFEAIGCADCHVSTLVTAPPGTVFDGGFVVPEALGNKIIHPYSDFLLHDIGTGEGIVQGESRGDEIRTTPLWGLRTRSRLMHDGESFTVTEAILRHRGEAAFSRFRYGRLRRSDRRRVLAFLGSL